MDSVSKPKLMCDYKFGSACDFHRVVLPYQGNTIQPQCDVLVFNRVFSRGVSEVRSMKAAGVKIVVDLDDFYLLNPEHYLADVFTDNSKSIMEMLKLADVVTVTTELLASRVRHLNRNVVVIRNSLPFDQGQFTLSSDTESGTPVVWAGGASHEPDLSLIADTFDENLLTIAGYENYPQALKGSHQHLTSQEWLKIRQKFRNTGFKSAVKTLNDYMSVYDGHALAVAPLVDNDFNVCKSNLKILEAGAKGIPIVCSKVLPYYNPIDSKVLIYAENKADWHYNIVKMLRNPNYLADYGSILAEHVRLHYNMHDANELRRQVIESLK